MEQPHLLITAHLCQALSSPVRLRALNFLAQGPWPVGRLAGELGRSVASTSAHLKSLKAASLIESEKHGHEVRYRVTSIEVLRALSAVQSAAEATSPAFREWSRGFDADPHLFPEWDMGRFAKILAAGKAVLLDFRTHLEFATGHLPGAISRPFETLWKIRKDDFDLSKEIIAYCRGRWCKKAYAGVNLLNQAGLPVRRLRGGAVEWRLAGLALEE
ncbi:MAG: ArsR/SmtB family transcription factor [Puniceicoccaceae bacterium]